MKRLLLAGLALADQLRSEAYAGGADFLHQFAGRDWAVGGK